MKTSRILREFCGEKIPERFTYVFDRFNWIAKSGVKLYNVEWLQLINSKWFCYDISNFMRMKSVINPCPSWRDVAWVQRVHVEWYVNRKLGVFTHEIYRLLWCVVTDVVFLYRLCFEIIDVTNSDVNKSVKRKLLETNSWCPVRFFESSTNRQRSTVFVATNCRCVGVNVGMSIDPDYVKISKLLKGSEDWRTCHWVITT